MADAGPGAHRLGHRRRAPRPVPQLLDAPRRRHVHARRHVGHHDPRQRLRPRRGTADAPGRRRQRGARGRGRNNYRLDYLFNGGNSTTNSVEAPAPDPLLAEFQKTDPATGKPYTQDFGWLNHTWDHAYLDVGCATTNYIEAEVQQNTLWAASAPGPRTAPAVSASCRAPTTRSRSGPRTRTALVPGGHSGFANLVPGNADAVDPPNLDDEVTRDRRDPRGRQLPVGADRPVQGGRLDRTDQSSASVTTPITVTAGQGEVACTWQAVCHAANYLVYREVAGSNNWSLVGSRRDPGRCDSAGDAHRRPHRWIDHQHRGRRHAGADVHRHRRGRARAQGTLDAAHARERARAPVGAEPQLPHRDERART